MPIPWAAALRVYAKQVGYYSMPRKGTDQYNAVKNIQANTAMAPEHELRRRGGKAAMGGRAEPMPGGLTERSPQDLKFAGPPAYAFEPAAPKVATKPIEQPPVLPPPSKVVEPEKNKPKRKRKPVTTTGLTEVENVREEIINDNTGSGGVVAPQFPGQKEDIKAALKASKKTPKMVTVGQGQEATIDNLKSDDPKALKGENVQFSFQALRSKLLC